MTSTRRRIVATFLCFAAGLVITIVLVVVIVVLQNSWINRAATASGLTAYRYQRWGFGFITTGHPEFPRYWSDHLSSHIEVGWPLPCVRTPECHPNDLRARRTRSEQLAFLRRPMPLGVLANTAIIGMALWTVLCGPAILLRGHRARGGRCPFCGYPVGGSTVCTECGSTHGLVTEAPVNGEPG